MVALLVVGSAPCALDDLAKAKALYPDAEIMAVNGACTMVREAHHMLSGHTVKAEEFVRERKRAFPDAPMPRVHANTLLKNARQYARQYPSVTDWWGPEMSSGATSAGKAALIGIRMGFYPIILCGCPMDGSGYHPGDAKVKHDASCARVGDPTKQDRRMIKSYHEKMAALAKTDFKDRVYSMSGFTKMHLGGPPEEWLC
jgi:hypothetical protein